jgi:hypothetical protein
VATNDDDGEDMTRTASSMTTNCETDTIGDGGDMAIDYDNGATCSSTAAAALATTERVAKQKKPSSKQSHSQHARRDVTKAAIAAFQLDSGRQ